MNTLQRFIKNRSQTSVQFIKYAIAGAIATGVHFVIFTILNETVLPADVNQHGVRRGWNFFWSFSIAFILANVVSHLANRRWVFEAGRHTRLVEIGFFYLVSVTAYLLGAPLGVYLVAKFPLSEYLVYLMVVVSSILVNFLGRKFLVFQH